MAEVERAPIEELRASKQDDETRPWISTWKLSLGGLRGWKRAVNGEDGESYVGKVRGQPIAVIWSIAKEADDLAMAAREPLSRRPSADVGRRD